LILQCVGTAHSEEQFRDIKSIIASIRPLESVDREKITYKMLYVEQGGDETLLEFAERKGDAVLDNINLTAIINRLDTAEDVHGKQVKYIRTESFFESSNSR
jgi:hypothetical protein